MARLGALLRGCTLESRFLFECGPSRLPSEAQQVRVMLFELEVIAHAFQRLVLELHAFVLLPKDCCSVSRNYGLSCFKGRD